VATDPRGMTTSRTCQRCGADLPADIRWCGRCYEPIRELSPRSPIHDDDFVGSPIHERGDIPRWTRWEATATTFGPWGRIGLTVLVFATLIPALAFNGFVYAITFPVLAAVLLREIWAKGWYVPETGEDEDTPATPQPESPARAEVEVIPVGRLIRWALLIAAAFAFAYGNMGVKTGIIGLAGIATLAWLWRRLDT
jgi:hypothetical protein